MDKIRAGDTVLHRPSGETWVVCGVNYDRGQLIPCGWPFPTLAMLADCELVERRKTAGPPGGYNKALMDHGFESFTEKEAAAHGS